MKNILAMLLLLSGPALGQTALDVDFDALFEGDETQIELNGVTVVRETFEGGGVQYVTNDTTDQGAVGCWMMIAVHASAMDRKCELAVNPSERHALDTLLGGIAKFYAAHNQPVLAEGNDLPSVREAIEFLIRDEKSSIPDAACTGDAADFAESFIDGLSVVADEEEFFSRLGPARLPVANPCF